MRAALRFDHVTKTFVHHAGQMLLARADAGNAAPVAAAAL